MLHPTIDELTQGKFNRYELALATARCARLITDEYVRQHDAAERSQTGNKETDRPINTMIDRELRDEKAVKVAIRRIANGDFIIDENAADYEPIDLAAEHEAEMQARYPDFSDDEEDEDETMRLRRTKRRRIPRTPHRTAIRPTATPALTRALPHRWKTLPRQTTRPKTPRKPTAGRTRSRSSLDSAVCRRLSAG